MRCHVLSDVNGSIIALELPVANESGGRSRFVCKAPDQICREVEMAPELLRQIRADGRQIVPLLRVVEMDGRAQLVA